MDTGTVLMESCVDLYSLAIETFLHVVCVRTGQCQSYLVSVRYLMTVCVELGFWSMSLSPEQGST